MSTIPAPSNVLSAFDLLLDALEAEIDHIHLQAARAFLVDDHDGAHTTVARADSYAALRARVADLRHAWHSLATATPAAPNLPRALPTPEVSYYVPILRALAAYGGRASLPLLLYAVRQTMQPLLQELDRMPSGGDHDAPRWRIAAQNALHEMVAAGLLQADASHGIWKISAAGEAYMMAQNPG